MLIPERSALSRRRGTIIAFIGLLCEPRNSLMYLRDRANESVNAEAAYPGSWAQSRRRWGKGGLCMCAGACVCVSVVMLKEGGRLQQCALSLQASEDLIKRSWVKSEARNHGLQSSVNIPDNIKQKRCVTPELWELGWSAGGGGLMQAHGGGPGSALWQTRPPVIVQRERALLDQKRWRVNAMLYIFPHGCHFLVSVASLSRV